MTQIRSLLRVSRSSLRHGDRGATVVELGGALRSFSVGDWNVLDGYGSQERCTGARRHSLIPVAQPAQGRPLRLRR